MFKGFVLSESLKNPLVLNDLEKDYVKIESHPESCDSLFWHLFKVNISDGEIEEVLPKICNELKEGWYAHFWNENIVYVCFPEKYFKIKREKEWQSKEFLNVKNYAVSIGIDERYLDFFIED